MTLKPWSYDEEELIRKRWAENKSPREIAKELGHPRTSSSVQAKANRMGMKQRRESVAFREQEPPESPPNNEPCPFCGIAGFRGCKHRPASEPAPRITSRIWP